jgi:hypothetical protein
VHFPGEAGVDVRVGGDVLGVVVADEAVAERAAVADENGGGDGDAESGASQAAIVARATSGRAERDWPLGEAGLLGGEAPSGERGRWRLPAGLGAN